MGGFVTLSGRLSAVTDRAPASNRPGSWPEIKHSLQSTHLHTEHTFSYSYTDTRLLTTVYSPAKRNGKEKI